MTDLSSQLRTALAETTAALEAANADNDRLREQAEQLRRDLAAARSESESLRGMADLICSVQESVERLADAMTPDPAVERMLQECEGLLRKAEGNPYHKGSGEGGGQFTSGPDGGDGSAKPHGKHHAKRQRRKLRQKKNPKKPRKSPDSESHGAGGGSGGRKGKRSESHSPNAKERLDRLKKGKPAEYASEKARRAALSQNKTDAEVQTYTKANEERLAKRLGGESFPDNEPADVHVKLKDGSTRGLEVKTLTHGKNDKVTMKGSALARKVEFQQQTGNTMYTVVLDHRDRFAGGRNKELHSGNELWLKTGTGSFRVGNMHPVKDDAELKRLIRMSPDELAKISPKLKGDTRGTSK